MSARTIGLLCLVVPAPGWGLNWPAMKFLLQEWPPLFARGSAGVVAPLIVAAAARVQGQSLALPLVGEIVARSSRARGRAEPRG